MTKTIFALATPPGRSAIQIIRVSGPGAARALRRLAGFVPPPRQARMMLLKDKGGLPLDQAMVLFFKGPASATGEDLAEFHLHGSPVLGRMVMLELEEIPGLRLAEPGEFTRRAFLEGKINLDQAEAIGDIIDADTSRQHYQAMAQLDGALTKRTDEWRSRLISLSAHLEAIIDFADEDLPESVVQDIRTGTSSLIDDLQSALANAEAGIITRDGVTVALIGLPNAGKSTLLNALAGDERAIVSPEAGTTRDIIRVSLDISGIPVHLVDTAGIRDAISIVEKEGVRRAIKAAASASIVLVLVDQTTSHPARVFHEIRQNIMGKTEDEGLEMPKLIPVLTKSDLPTGAEPLPEWLMISASTGKGMAQLEKELIGHIEDLTTTTEPPILTRQRHLEALQTALSALKSASHLDMEHSPELMAEEFRHAAHALGRLTGRVDVEDLLDHVFSAFCIGK
ncbi:MAG: tRNA uridine-5-carboxymethylaminomethyl(34) synthesis GTPase MnmE [Alphaproteobacteria bacterium]|nr:tRNA uridine-5-carboxymethylaminomethyl(34) synthesis GTPase MnmE [Alphaproteobacteria bacterium]